MDFFIDKRTDIIIGFFFVACTIVEKEVAINPWFCFLGLLWMPFIVNKFYLKVVKKYFEIDFHIWNYDIKIILICTVIEGVFYLFPQEYFPDTSFVKNIWNSAEYSILFSLVLSCALFLFYQFEDINIDVNQCLDDSISIGAFWAEQAVLAYYKLVLESLPSRIREFEEENDVTMLIQKLLVLVPLSCNLGPGDLHSVDEEIEFFGNLRVIECDQGANNNRQYRNPIYKFNYENEERYVPVEFPSPLRVLWVLKDKMSLRHWNYHRNCFIKSLKELTKDYPCLVYVFDDTKEIPLHEVIYSAVRERTEISIPS